MRRVSFAFVLALLFASPASAQRIDACDISWLDTLRLRAVLRVELASIRPSALAGVTFVITGCNQIEAEARIVRAGVVLERRLVGVEDVAPNLRARLLAFVLAELVRVSTGLEPAPDEPAPVASVPPPDVPPHPRAGASARRTQVSDVPSRTPREDAPPIMRQHSPHELPPDVSPRATDPTVPLDDRISVTMDTGVRWFPRQWSRVSSSRVRIARKHLVIESRYSRGPLLYEERGLPSAFATVEFSGGARIGRRGPKVDFDVALLASVGFLRPLETDVYGPANQGPGRTPLYGVSLAFRAERKFAHALLIAGFDLGFLVGVDHTGRLPIGYAPIGEMRGMTFGVSVGVGLGTHNGG